jgi:fruB
MLKTIKTKKNTTKYTLVALVAGFALLSVGSSYIHARSAQKLSNSNLSNITANTNTDGFQQSNHYNTPKGFMNDIQTIFKGTDDYYHLYYLLNKNYKSSNDGTEWYHIRTKDWEHFEDLGVAIPKFVNGWSAVASGSVYQNRNGFFHDLPKTAIIAYFTSYTETGQHQYAAYSLDDGRTYHPYNHSQPVMKAKSKEQNFRDPHVWYNESTKKLMMYLAEGDKVGIYSSTDGKKWEYQGATMLNGSTLDGKDLGLIECPNLKSFYDPQTKITKHALLFGANGYQYGSTTGSYYMIGHLEANGNFVAEQQPERLDYGTDYYGANYYQESPTRVKSIGWMGNWEYSQGQILKDDGQEAKHIGSMSSTHSLSMTQKDGKYVVRSRLINNNARTSGLRTKQSARTSKIAPDGYHKELLKVNRKASQEISLHFANNTANTKGHVRVFINQNDSRVSVDLNTETGTYEVKRNSSKITGEAKNKYEKAYAVYNDWQNRQRYFVYLVADKGSLEIAMPDGQIYSLMKLSSDPNMQVVVESSTDNSVSATLCDFQNKTR